MIKLSTSRGVGDFTVKPMSGMKALRLLPRLTSKIGGLDIASFAQVSRVLKVFDEAEVDYLVKEVLYSVTVDFEDGSQDNEVQKHLGEIFAGNADQILHLLYHGLTVNVSEEVRSFLESKATMLKELASALSTTAQKLVDAETPPAPQSVKPT